MRILVTGGHGFVGRAVCRSLKERSVDFRAPKRSAEFNLAERSTIESMLHAYRPDGIIHLAWVTEPGAYWTCPSNLDWVSRSLDLLRSFADTGGKRIFLAGTSAEYDWSQEADHCEREPIDQPQKLYGVAKDALHRIAEKWAETLGLSLVWGRIFCPFGAEEDERRLIPRAVRKLALEGVVEISGGREERDFLHVDDLGDAIVETFFSDAEGPVNLARGEAESVRNFLLRFAKELRGNIEFDGPDIFPGSATRIAASVSKLRNQVGWKPRVTVEDRVRQVCESLSKSL